MTASSSASNALKSFSLNNDIVEISPQDAIFKFDPVEHKATYDSAPWTKDINYFKKCRISAVALIKMVMHARSGVPYEIMGLVQGRAVGSSFVIMDSFALPVQGTETRVNTLESANEYMVEYLNSGEKIHSGELGQAIGWYHSHPGYGCWLSGIDVATQSTHQKFEDPFIAVVIDPNRTISAGKVDIGAFRTYPEGCVPPGGSKGSEYQSIPLSKIEDFGVHANQYYSLEVEVFKSSLDDELLGKLWNKYWVNTLSSSPLISNRAYAVSQLTDLHNKLVNAQKTISSTHPVLPALVKTNAGTGSEIGQPVPFPSLMKGKEKEIFIKTEEKKEEESQFQKSVKDAIKIAAEGQHGLIAQVLKDAIFSTRSRQQISEAQSIEGILETAIDSSA